MKKPKRKKIVESKALVRSPQSDYVKETCKLIKLLQLLGIIKDVRMRQVKTAFNSTPQWALQVECEVNDNEAT